MRFYQMNNPETNNTYYIDIDQVESVVPVEDIDGNVVKLSLTTKSGNKYVSDVGGFFAAVEHAKVEVNSFTQPEETTDE